MRAIDPELQARLDGGATRLCRCWRVRRRDGVEFGFTDHDEDVVFEGVVHRASSGMDASALQSATGLSVDNAQAMGALSGAAVSEADIRAGRYDRAEIRHWLVDWERPDLRVLMFRGSFGEIRRNDGAFEVELRGLAEALSAPVGRSMLRTCDRVLGDAKCGFDVATVGFSGEGEVTAVGAELWAAGLAAFADGWFRHGRLTWLSGANAGEVATVMSDRLAANGARVLRLWRQPGCAVAVGDRFRIVAGCDKQRGADRRTRMARGVMGNERRAETVGDQGHRRCFTRNFPMEPREPFFKVRFVPIVLLDEARAVISVEPIALPVAFAGPVPSRQYQPRHESCSPPFSRTGGETNHAAAHREGMAFL